MNKYTKIVAFDVGTERPTTEYAEHLEGENEALRIKPAESLEDIVSLVEKAMRCIEATGEGLYTETFDGELTDAFNTLDDALATLKPQLTGGWVHPMSLGEIVDAEETTEEKG